MSRLLTDHTLHDASEPTFRESIAQVMTSSGLEELRRDRLFELRAVIESLRQEHSPAPSNAVPACRVRS
jgi:hypothetical protein